MWQSGGMGTHVVNNPWMKLMGIVHKERRHHDTAGTINIQGTVTIGIGDRGQAQ